MRRLFEWAGFVLKEKVNVFTKGFCGGSIVSGIFLFGSNLHHAAYIGIEYLVKLLVVAVSGVISGAATVIGNDLVVWMKAKKRQRRIRKVSNRKNKAA